MTERGHKILLAAEALVLLVPLTLIAALLTALSYPAYPIPLHPLQLGFDLAMLFKLAAIVAAWRLTVLYLRRGREGVKSAHAAWPWLLAVGAAIGLAGAAISVEHMMNPTQARSYVGFALLAPAAALVPVYVHLLRERRRARQAAVRIFH
jgi:hypothetical protein